MCMTATICSAPRILELQDATPRESGDLTYFKSRRSFGSAALAHTLPQVGNFRLPLMPSLLPPPARTTIWVRIKWILPRTLVISGLGEGVTVNIEK
jgi:hypothetical protein